MARICIYISRPQERPAETVILNRRPAAPPRRRRAARDLSVTTSWSSMCSDFVSCSTSRSGARFKLKKTTRSHKEWFGWRKAEWRSCSARALQLGPRLTTCTLGAKGKADRRWYEMFFAEAECHATTSEQDRLIRRWHEMPYIIHKNTCTHTHTQHVLLEGRAQAGRTWWRRRPWRAGLWRHNIFLCIAKSGSLCRMWTPQLPREVTGNPLRESDVGYETAKAGVLPLERHVGLIAGCCRATNI
jgi:hypothetical protein